MIVSITINSKIHLKTRGIPEAVLQQVKEDLTILNPEWLQKKIAGAYLGNTEEKIGFYEEQGSKILLPRGFLKNLSAILSPYNPSYQARDNTQLLDNININIKPSNDNIWDFQDKAIKHIIREPSAVLNFPTGGGKTVTGIKLICKRKQPTLIVVHSKELLYQWKESLLKYTNIDEKDIGLIGDGKKSTGIITIGIINSLYKRIEAIKHFFGQVIIDEVHRLPGRCFKEVVGEMDCYYILGLSATPKRSDSQTKVIFFYCGELEYEIKPPDLIDKGVIVKPVLIPKYTLFEFDPTEGKVCPSGGNIGKDYNKLGIKCTDHCPKENYIDCCIVKKMLKNKWLYMMDKLIKDDLRNHFIIEDVLAYLSSTPENEIPLIVSDRIEHCLELEKLLKKKNQGLHTGILTSLTSDKERRGTIEKVKEGKIRVLFAGCKLIGEGFDCKYLSAIFLTTPISFDGRLVQYIGRILRKKEGKKEASIYDYVDNKVPILKKSFNKRKKGYRHMGIDI
jgi:superfamily II DNA or RNA helicase